jgi:hypothetical protein
MTAQPLDMPGPIDRPRTVGAIRDALPSNLHAAFQAALDESAPEDLFALVAQWAAVAQTSTDARTDAAARAVRAGTSRTYEIGDIFPALAGTL